MKAECGTEYENEKFVNIVYRWSIVYTHFFLQIISKVENKKIKYYRMEIICCSLLTYTFEYVSTSEQSFMVIF